jgi:phospholipid transport system substrate-binding protein
MSLTHRSAPSLSRREFSLAALPFAALAGLAALTGFAQTSYADGGPTPQQAIRTLCDEAFGIMRDEQLKKDRKVRIAKLRGAVDKVLDWEEMAKSSLGAHWRKITDPQRSEFVNVFKDLLARQYMEDVDRFQGTEKVTVKDAEVRGELQIVRTTLLTASKELIPIDYTLHKATQGWRVSDFSVEGVSMVNHFRGTFNRFLVNKDINELIKQLRTKLGNL